MDTQQVNDKAIADWLLRATSDPAAARLEWQNHGLTLVRCGTFFSAVRIPDRLVFAAARTEDLTAVATTLDALLRGSGVIHDPAHQRFYVLVPKHTAGVWYQPDADCLGRDFFLGVPPPDRRELNPAAWVPYWIVPMPSLGWLCNPSHVIELVCTGRTLLATDEHPDEA